MTYYYYVAAVNANGQSARSNGANATAAQGANNEIIAIESGGTVAVSNFVPDVFWGGSTTVSTTSATITTTGIANAAPAAVYQSERYGNGVAGQDLLYNIPGLTPGATYKVRLHNSENYWTAAGQREFNVTIEGVQVLTNFDIFNTTGAKDKAVVNDFNTVVDSTGHLVIDFSTGAKDLPTIKGVEIFFVSGPTLGTPTGVTPNAGNAQVTLNWTAVSGATSYNIYRSTTAGSETFLANAANPPYTDTGLTNGTTYYYKVAAVNGSATSGQSTEVNATPQIPLPGVPSGLSATASNAQVALTWTASAYAASYDVYRSTTTGGEGTTPIKTGLTSTAFTDTGLTNGTKYFYTVSAVNATGTSAQSSEINATPTGVPAAPVLTLNTTGNGQISLSWTSSTGATSYNVNRSTASGAETPIATGLTVTTYTNTGLTNGTKYYYTVTAVNSAGTSAPSNEVSGTPNTGAPATPTGLDPNRRQCSGRFGLDRQHRRN